LSYFILGGKGNCLESLALNGIPHFALSGLAPQAKSAPASAHSSLNPYDKPNAL